MNNNKIDESVKINEPELQEEKICCICGIKEKDAISKSINILRMSDILNEKCSKEFNSEMLSIFPETSKKHICAKCIEITNEAVEKVLNCIDKENDAKTLEKLRGDIESFEDYISSTAHLFKLDHITVMQACSNMLISGARTMSDYSPKLSKTIIKTAIIELERELHKLEE